MSGDNCGPGCNYWCPDHPGCGLEGHKMSWIWLHLIRIFGCPYGEYREAGK
jgi:hypothetical protein